MKIKVQTLMGQMVVVEVEEGSTLKQLKVKSKEKIHFKLIFL